ncbi:LacI family DNA-binding transcriptional regulator [Aeromicrobium halocynthiae]|uniref:LacI family DNA-binding transcriptional regulator n=1 Tax=Aeromicrobium halocynthiae TaxID=560557 RepID=A0ABN2VWD2_9ACTN
MPHRHKVREIAQQSGLSAATVDRVLHGRPGVRAATVAEVERAIEELDRQATQLRLVGRTFLLDLVMQAPARFSSAVRDAMEAELPGLRPAVVRSRFHLREEADAGAMVATLRDVRRRRSHGVVLKAPDHPDVAAEVTALADSGVPVVTLVTDVPGSRRLAYVGIDNDAAGRTAAYLVALGSPGPGAVLVTLSRSDFRGEEQRVGAFVDALGTLAPGRRVVDLTDTDGLDPTTGAGVRAALAGHPDVDAVYSVGGGNRATLDAFADAGRTIGTFVAHDLDADNTELLRTRRIHHVLHHDLRADARHACRLILQHHGALPGAPTSVPSQVQVVTPFNVPRAFGPR